MAYGMRKEVDQIVKSLRSQGWTCTVTKKCHWKLQSPEGGVVFAPTTPGSIRGLRNLRADLRRLGADV